MKSDAIIEWQGVCLPASAQYEIEIPDLTFALEPGEIMMVYIDNHRYCPPFADTACGLLKPSRGRILFKGRDWQSMMAGAVAAARSRIGRVFETNAWVSNLDLDENITLAQRHHTKRTQQDIRAEAEEWARRFGLPSLPAMRPIRASRQELMKSQWVRALLGQPELLLLERPCRDVSSSERRLLIDAVKEQLHREAAAIWLTSDEEVWKHMKTFEGVKEVDIRSGQEMDHDQEAV